MDFSTNLNLNWNLSNDRSSYYLTIAIDCVLRGHGRSIFVAALGNANPTTIHTQQANRTSNV